MMQSIDHLRRLFKFNAWANVRILEAVRNCNVARAREIATHLVIAEREYFERLHGKDSTGFDFWPERDLDELVALATKNRDDLARLLERFDDEGLDMRVSYRTSSGVVQVNSFREMLTHVVLHSATHRGNVVFALRDSGIDPPNVDYIVFLRELAAT